MAPPVSWGTFHCRAIRASARAVNGAASSLTSGHWLTGWARANAAQTPFERLFERHGEHPDLRRFVERLAQTIAIEMNVLDPERLIRAAA